MGHTALATNFLAIGSAEVLFVMIVGLVTTVVGTISLVDALRIADETWQRAGQSEVLWILLVVLLGLLGSLLYTVMARPALTRARVSSL